MVDWTASMQQTFEYYVVDPGTWKDTKRIDSITKSSINRDSETDTLGSASIDITESLGECYVRIYLVTIQNGIRERHPLGTFLVQTPTGSFDGKITTYSVDAYTPLIELKENPPPIGYSLLKGENIMKMAYMLTRENARAPVSETISDETLTGNFVAEPDEKWLSFLSYLIANAKHSYGLDELGRILFIPKQDTASLQPVWTYSDDGCSILHPEITIDRDLFDIPNVVEVVYSNGGVTYYSKVVNDDPNSPTSTINRGRKITYRDPNPSLIGMPTQAMVDEYATQLLRDLSSIECKISYTHAYCPVRLGDCVRLNNAKAGLVNIKAKVIYQNIKCEPGCPVSEKAIATIKLWG